MPFLFFSIAKGKLPTYILPCMAPLALLMAHYVSELIAQGKWRTLKVNAAINILFGGVLALAVIVMAVGNFKSSLYALASRVRLSLAYSALLAGRYLAVSHWLKGRNTGYGRRRVLWCSVFSLLRRCHRKSKTAKIRRHLLPM